MTATTSTSSQFNWAGTYRYSFSEVQRPTSVEQLQEVVAAAPKLKVLGSRHSFSGIADGPVAVTLRGLPAEVDIDGSGQVAWVPGAITYGSLARELHQRERALHNLASLPHISVAGAIATATHGSGRGNGNLASAVQGLEMVQADGTLITLHRGDPDFEGAVVHLGALGVITRVALQVEPEYEVAQTVYENLPWELVTEHLDELLDAAYSVSIFTDRPQRVTQVWMKQRTDRAPLPTSVFGARSAVDHVHPLPGFDPVNCTRQMGIPGLWSDRLPHFRMEFTPSNGEELQSEYHLPRHRAVDAIRALLPLRERLASVLQDWEIRAVAQDDLWLSPQYQRDTVAVHMTWDPDSAGVLAALEHVEGALAPFDARPHWGKVFLPSAEPAVHRYPRAQDFRALMRRMDPEEKFVNAWIESNILGRSATHSAIGQGS